MNSRMLRSPLSPYFITNSNPPELIGPGRRFPISFDAQLVLEAERQRIADHNHRPKKNKSGKAAK
jgi:hypothetical protein